MTYTAEEQRARYYANLEENRRKAREYARKNRDKLNERRRELRARDGDRIRNSEREYRRNRPRKRDRAADARDRHGPWAAEDWSAMWDAQAGRCYLCGEEMLPEKEKIDVDHDHSCCRQGKSCRVCRRGLAHHSCNVAVGYAGDSPDRLRRMADALEAAQTAFAQRRSAIESPNGEQLTFALLNGAALFAYQSNLDNWVGARAIVVCLEADLLRDNIGTSHVYTSGLKFHSRKNE